MVTTREYLERIVERILYKKVAEIENKLKNSFSLIKKDNLAIINSLGLIRESLKKEGFSEQLIHLQKSLDKELKKFEEKIKTSQDKVLVLEKRLNKARIKEDLEKTLFGLFNKKIELNFSKQKNYFVRSLNNVYSDLQIAKKSFRGEFSEIENKISSIHEDFRRKIEEIEQERKRELLSLKRQIAYLKGIINDKKINKEKKNFISRVIDKISDN